MQPGTQRRAYHTHPFNGPLSGTTRVSRYHRGKTKVDFTEARDSEWQWHQLGHMQVCTSLQTDNHTSTPPLAYHQLRNQKCKSFWSDKLSASTNPRDMWSTVDRLLGRGNRACDRVSADELSRFLQRRWSGSGQLLLHRHRRHLVRHSPSTRPCRWMTSPLL